MLKACGALLFSADAGDFWAVFDEEFELRFSAAEIEGTSPALTCRTTDVENLQIRKDSLITRADFQRKVYRVVSDGAGQTILLLTK